MEDNSELELSPYEQILANTFARLAGTDLFSPEQLSELTEAAASGSLSKAKEVEAILARDTLGASQ